MLLGHLLMRLSVSPCRQDVPQGLRADIIKFQVPINKSLEFQILCR